MAVAEYCDWELDGINDNDVEIWKGTCEALMIEHPTKWNYKFCPYCGCKIKGNNEN